MKARSTRKPNTASRHNKIVSGTEAINKIKDGATVATGGFCGAGFAEDLAIYLEDRFVNSKEPKNLTLLYCAGQGDYQTRGLNHLGYIGLVKKVIGGFFGAAPKLVELVIHNKIQAYNFPQGVISHMLRDIAAHKPRTITSVGLNTFVDPRREGGKANTITKDDLVELITFDDKEYLAYKTFPIDVALLRGTTADENGNVTMEKEALTLETQAMAMATKNSGGIVIVQVEGIASAGSLKPKEVKIPGILVDYVVVARPENHWQTFAEKYDPALSGERKIPVASLPKMEMNARKIVARRAAQELKPGQVVNLGIGMPEGISNIANEEEILDQITLTAEPGIIGGLPCGGLSFGAGINPDAIIDQPSQFDFYHGGGLDMAFLGLAQVDQEGNLNVSKFGIKMSGAGGFIDITQNAKQVVFTGTFTAGKLSVSIQNGQLSIDQEGENHKFPKQVEQVTFSALNAINSGQPVLYITERCVFTLGEKGLILSEIAPGIDLEKDILARMEFKPEISASLKLMDPILFQNEVMGLKKKFG
jgi:propionate CoA-transferase